MTALILLVPIALLLGSAGLVAFFWTVRSSQYDDLEGAAQRILNDDASQPAKYDEQDSQ